ncbi:VOC family protein [Dietzia sp. UBA5065]|jgi:predicted enzyme related to lactoylglutathione lyase|uniref:VOC family protein n=1 Tax=Dietzia sp. UBA5065 TaxID=1946422 RepID=UPI0025C11CBC|nr:VOC family protein [Dietzia sp. UBA5065]HMT49129.1 VOC family protein [Dietzia sp.]
MHPSTPLEITLVEFPSTSMSATSEFLQAVCGWTPTVYGQSYTHLFGGGIDVGVQGDAHEQSPAPLMVIRVADLDEARARVEAAGGTVTFGPFDFTGGRRFHFREPGGNEMAMWVPA